MSLWSFQGPRELAPALRENAGPKAGLSKLNSVRPLIVEVDVILGELSGPTAEAIKGLSAYRHELPDSLERR